jgi:acetyl-CoA carboxylase carboxyl transferase beta subunit/acetyl-CoA carboxylase carboxyl transferase alpha subunit
VTLQPIENLGQPVVAHTIDEVEIDAGILQGAAEPHHQRHFLRGQVVAVALQRPGQVVPRGAAKLGVVHRLLGQPLQDLNSHRACVGKRHVSIVLVQTCYGLSDRDCTSLATVAAYPCRWSMQMKRSTEATITDSDARLRAEDRETPPVSPIVGTPKSLTVCPKCATPLADNEVFATYRVCPICGRHERESARAAIVRLTDPESFREHDTGLVSTDPLHFEDDTHYRHRLLALREETGESDALVTGFARLGDQEIAIAALDFAFLGGSMGVVVGEKLVRIAERARDKHLPLVTISASGGARMQEGMFSLLQMAKTSAAIQRLKTAGSLYVSILAHPTTGGVFASFANLGDLLIAEPGALIGFAGPRVAEQVTGEKLPDGSHTAEFLYTHGMIDAIVDRREQRDLLSRALNIVAAPRSGYQRRGRRFRAPRGGMELPAWDAVQRARASDRMTSVDFLQRILGDLVELHGDRASGDDPAVVAGIGTLDGKAIAVVALERGHLEDRLRRHDGRPYPEGYRKARRVMELAERLRVPLVTLIDTPGAYPGVEAEERGLASELATSLARMSTLRTPIVSAVIGEGGSGGALALAVADRVLMLEGAIYSVIAPEGAATILYRDAARAPELSTKLKLTAAELKRLGIIDEVIPDPVENPNPDALAAALAEAVMHALGDLQRKRIGRLVNERYDRYQRFGRRHARRPRRIGLPRRRLRLPRRRVASAAPD